MSDGIFTLCNLVDMAEKGDAPKERLRPVYREYYGERTVGFSRYYESLGAGEQVDMLIRTRYDKRARIGCYIVLEDEQYRITNVQKIVDEGLNYCDITLSRLDKNYELDF